MEKNLQSAEALDKLKELVESVHICMYCTMQQGSDMASRPMGTAGIEDDGTIWFFTSDHTTAAQRATGETEVCLNYAHPGKNLYLCVMGNAQLVHDKEKMKELWNPILKTWFSQGLETPDISLVKVTPRSAYYWDSNASRLRVLFSFIKAEITGKPTEGSEGDHGMLDVGDNDPANETVGNP